MTVALAPSPKFQAFTAAGVPLVGGKLYTYASGTTTPLATYTDMTGGTPNTNPIILNSRGEANVILTENTPYTFVLADANDVVIWTVDDIVSVGLNPTTLTKYATGDLISTTTTVTWPASGTTTFLWHLPVPHDWQAGTTINFRVLRRSSETSTTAKFTYTLTRLRVGATPVTLSSGTADFAPGTTQTYGTAFNFDASQLLAGDLLAARIERLGDDSGDAMTVAVSYDGHRWEYTGYAGQ